MDIRLRPLDAPDAVRYRTIRLNALRLAPTAFSSSFETCRLLPDEFFLGRATFFPDNFIFGAFHDEALIGTAGGYVDPEKKRNHIAFVVGMWVEPDYRKLGIGRKLLTCGGRPAQITAPGQRYPTVRFRRPSSCTEVVRVIVLRFGVENLTH